MNGEFPGTSTEKKIKENMERPTTLCIDHVLPSWSHIDCSGISSSGSSYLVHVHGKHGRHMLLVGVLTRLFGQAGV